MEKKEVFAEFDVARKNFEEICRLFDAHPGDVYLNFAVNFVYLKKCEIYEQSYPGAADAREYLELSKRRFIKRMMYDDNGHVLWGYLLKDVLAKNRITSDIADVDWYLISLNIRDWYLELLAEHKNAEFAAREECLMFLNVLDEYIAPLMGGVFSELEDMEDASSKPE